MTELQNYRMTEWQNDRMTDRTKTICPPIFDLGGIKMLKLWIGKIQVMHTSGTGNLIYILDQWSVWTHRFLEFAQFLYFTGHILDEQEWFMVHFICGILNLLFAQFIPQLCAHCIFGSYIVSFFMISLLSVSIG